MDLPQRYDPKEAEPRWQKYWAEEEIFAYHPNSPMETFSVDTPPPTVSGKMHMGHAFSYTQQDIIVRYQRMKSRNVFFPFGTDDNGLPTERLVEKSKNILSTQIPRQGFVRICNEYIQQEKPAFIQSWKDIGMSADFSKSYSTINKHCQITSQASFIDLFRKGRIYQQEAPGVYCVACQTAIAQAEFESVDMKSHFNDIIFTAGGKELLISTTRPELVPACVALFYHPLDRRYQALKGKFAKVPLFDYEVPLLPDDSVDMEKGTGLMMVCTFGDKEDVDKWFRFKLPLRVVLEKNGRMNELAGDFKGMKIKDARQAILKKLNEKNLLPRQIEITHAVNVHERCKTGIEFLKTKQWYIKILDKKEELLELANKIIWHPSHMKVRYDHWVENLNWDWCISRQRHFGIPLPVWRCARCQAFQVPELRDLPVDPTVNKPKKTCSCGSLDFVGETDVLDTWATSSVTPEITGNWVHRGEYDYKFANEPFDLRPQAHDIIRTWLFYTMVKSYFHHGRIPWKKVMISGHAQDPHGRKMSKSLGNIIEPQEMIKKYSADALRFWAAGSTLGDDLPFQEKDLLTGQKFVNKLWNASKFCLLHLEDYPHMEANAVTEISATAEISVVTEIFDQWLLSKLQKIVRESTANFEKYEYSKTKSLVENFFWHDFCDNYLEIVKSRLYNPDANTNDTSIAGTNPDTASHSMRGSKARRSAQYALYQTLLTILKMMAPIAPHVTEEIYHLFFASKENKKSIHLSTWPKFNSRLIDEKVELAGELGIDIIAAVRRFKSEQKVSLKEEIKILVLINEDKDFSLMIKSIEQDLKAVLTVREILFTGATTLVSEQFGVKIGVAR